MSKPARKIEPGWAVKTPRGHLLIGTAGTLRASSREAFRGYLGLDSWAAAQLKGYRLVRVILSEADQKL